MSSCTVGVGVIENVVGCESSSKLDPLDCGRLNPSLGMKSKYGLVHQCPSPLRTYFLARPPNISSSHRVHSTTRVSVVVSRMDLDPRLRKFRNQYHQQVEVDQLDYPSIKILREPKVQHQIFQYFFDPDKASLHPGLPYRRRTLKSLLSRIEASVVDPDEDVCSVTLIPICLPQYIPSRKFQHPTFWKMPFPSLFQSDSFITRRFRMS